MSGTSWVAWEVDCVQRSGRWSATVRGTGLPASTGHADPAALVFAAVDLMTARAGVHPHRMRLHPPAGTTFGAWFPPGRSDHRTRTVDGQDWSDTWTATPDPDAPAAVLVSTRSAAVPVRAVPTPRRPEQARSTDPTP